MAIGVGNPFGIGGRAAERMAGEANYIPLKTAKNLLEEEMGAGV
jgi:hypothetical protein